MYNNVRTYMWVCMFPFIFTFVCMSHVFWHFLCDRLFTEIRVDLVSKRCRINQRERRRFSIGLRWRYDTNESTRIHASLSCIYNVYTMNLELKFIHWAIYNSLVVCFSFPCRRKRGTFRGRIILGYDRFPCFVSFRFVPSRCNYLGQPRSRKTIDHQQTPD